MNLIIFGAPGSGKGTQSDNLSKDFNLIKISTGDLLRNEIDKSSELGKKIKDTIDKGSLVSDIIINNLIQDILSEKKNINRLIFDGYPRTLNQAKSLELLLNKFDQRINCVLSLNVEKDIIIKRIMGRQICSKCGLTFNEFFNPSDNKNHDCDVKFLVKRSDDQESTIMTRYDTYLKQSLPIINFYKEKNLLHEINGSGKIASIYKEIYAIISALKG